MFSLSIKGTWNDKATLPIKCPECGHTADELITKLQDARQCVCAGCGKTIVFTGNGLDTLKAFKETITKFK
jgi:DNA-directed RNA polymerase subunit RPC12/RpoP